MKYLSSPLSLSSSSSENVKRYAKRFPKLWPMCLVFAMISHRKKDSIEIWSWSVYEIYSLSTKTLTLGVQLFYSEIVYCNADALQTPFILMILQPKTKATAFDEIYSAFVNWCALKNHESINISGQFPGEYMDVLLSLEKEKKETKEKKKSK